jgi:hypothetical protein
MTGLEGGVVPRGVVADGRVGERVLQHILALA